MSGHTHRQTTHVRRRHRLIEGTSYDAFTPNGISGLVAWYDFSDPTTLFTDAGTTRVVADADLIYQANDKSGTAVNIIQATSGNRPLYKTAIVNGRSVARFVSNDWLRATLVFTQPLTAFVTYAQTGADANYCVPFSLGTSFSMNTNANGYLGAYGGSSLSGTTKRTPALGIAILKADGVSSHLYWDGTEEATGDIGSMSVSQINLGDNDDASNFPIVGDIAEVALYSAALSAANINSVGRYLTAKWGLAWTTVT